MKYLVGCICWMAMLGQVMADDPVPIRREIISPDRLAGALDRVKNGTLIQLKREEFESRVRKAATGLESRRRPPQLLKALYTAKFVEGRLAGSGQWSIRHDLDLPSRLNLEPLNLTIGSIAWADGSTVFAGALDKNSNAWELLVDAKGDRTLKLEWSAIGQRRPEGHLFDLRWPDCAIVELELDLPQHIIPKIPQNQGVCDQGRVVGDGRRIWTIVASGSTQLELFVQAKTEKSSNLLLRQRQRCHVTPGRVEHEFQLELNSGPSRFQSFAFDHDARLNVLEISSPQLNGWSLIPSTGNVPRIRVTMAAPVASATVNVRGISWPIENEPWQCPTLSMNDVGSCPEEITLNITPSVSCAAFSPGGLRLIDARTESNGNQQLTLVTSWSMPAESMRPACRFRWSGQTVDVVERRTWDIESQRQSVSCEIELTPQQQPLASWAVQLPVDWKVVKVEDRIKPGLQWSVQSRPDYSSQLQIEFDRPVPTGKTARLFLECRGKTPTKWNQNLAFPEFKHLQARGHAVHLGIRISPMFDADVRPGPLTLPVDISQKPPPDSGVDVRYSFPTGQVEGEVTLRPKLPRFSVIGDGRLIVRFHDVLCDYRLTVQPERGNIEDILIETPSRMSGSGRWHTTGTPQIRRVQRLDQLLHSLATVSSTTAMEAAVSISTSVQSDRSIWGISLSHPTDQPVTLEYTETLRPMGKIPSTIGTQVSGFGGMPFSDAIPGLAPPADRPLIDPPLWSVVGATNQEHIWRYVDPQGKSRPSTEWRSGGTGTTFRYQSRAPQLILDITDHPVRRLIVTEASMTVLVAHDGRLLAKYQAAVRSDGRRVSVELPEGANLLEAKVSGQSISAIRSAGKRLELDLPATGRNSVELTYSLPSPRSWPISRWEAPAPRWPGDITAPLWSWHLPHGWRACDYSQAETSITEIPSTSLPVCAVETSYVGVDSKLWVANSTLVWRASLVVALTTLSILVIVKVQPGIALLLLLTGMIAWLALPSPLHPLLIAPTFLPLLFALPRSLPWRNIRWVSATATALIWVWFGFAASNESATVFLMPGANGEIETALVPMDLIQTLDRLSYGGKPTADAILTESEFFAKVEGDQVRLTARWKGHALKPKAVLQLPLTGVEIAELKINGVDASAKTDGRTFTIESPTAGPVVLEAQLFASPKSSGALRTIRCEVPTTLMARCSIDLPPDARLVQPSNGHSFDLGRQRQLELTWRTSDAAPSQIVQEGYLWNLQNPSARLTGIVKIQGGENATRNLTIQIPDELSLASIRPDQSTVLLDWESKTGPMGPLAALQLSSPNPTSTVVLDFVPRGPLAITSAALPFPSVNGSVQTTVAWVGTARPGAVRGATSITEEDFRRDYLKHAPIDVKGFPIRAWRKTEANIPATIHVLPEIHSIWMGRPFVHWRLGPTQAEVRAHADLTSDFKQALVEWEVPINITIANVTGTNVANWSRTGSRLQVWLNQPRQACTIEWAGIIGRRSESTPFDVPAIRLVNATPGVELSLVARPGWDLTPMIIQQLTSRPGTNARELSLHSDRNNYRLTLQPRAAASTTEFRIVTSVEWDGRPTADITMNAIQSVGEVGSFLASLAALPTDDIHVDAGSARVTELPSPNGRRIWLIDPPAKHADEFRLVVKVRAASPSHWTVPRLTLECNGQKPAVANHLVTVRPNIKFDEPIGLESISPGQWRAVAEDWRLELHKNQPNPPLP